MKRRAYPNLAAVVAARGLTYAEVAAAVGVGATSVNHVLCGRRQPSAALRARFADALGVAEDVLFELNPDVAQMIEAAHAQGLGHLVTIAPGTTP